jgi:hypothetical protein
MSNEEFEKCFLYVIGNRYLGGLASKNVPGLNKNLSSQDVRIAKIVDLMNPKIA